MLFRSRFWVRVRIRVRVRVRVGVRVRVRFRLRVVIKPIPLCRYPLARKGILFGGPAMEKSSDTNKNLLYSTRNSTQYSVMAYMGKES